MVDQLRYRAQHSVLELLLTVPLEPCILTGTGDGDGENRWVGRLWRPCARAPSMAALCSQASAAFSSLVIPRRWRDTYSSTSASKFFAESPPSRPSGWRTTMSGFRSRHAVVSSSMHLREDTYSAVWKTSRAEPACLHHV